MEEQNVDLQNPNNEGSQQNGSTPSHATPSIRGSAEGQFTSLASSSSAPSSSSYPIKKRSLIDIYEKTKETNLFCLYAEPEPLTFQEAAREA